MFIMHIYNYNNHIPLSEKVLEMMSMCFHTSLTSFNFKSLVAFQGENCETPISCENLLRDFLGLHCNVCPILSKFSSVST
ncbi:hypothetical protein C0J52_13059 [Blattella germanica]|nr:hypothetical protein C0J52_13059 [Blattella germanica]